MYRPLADELRPKQLSEVCGQRHILGEQGLLRRIVESGNIPNLIFYGPSGTGKTTVANIIASQTQRTLYKLNATTASLSDIKEIVSQLDTFLTPGGALKYGRIFCRAAHRNAICFFAMDSLTALPCWRIAMKRGRHRTKERSTLFICIPVYGVRLLQTGPFYFVCRD